MSEDSATTVFSGLNPDRLVAFSDGVIAIAITLLVLGLEVPSAHEVPPTQLSSYLLASIHPLIGYVASFLLIGMYWLQHYAIFHLLRHANRTLVILNGLFLLFVSFLPFPTGLLAAYRHDELAVILFGSAHILCGLSLAGLWLYAVRGHRLVAEDIPDQVVTSMTRRIAVAPALSLAAIALSLVNIWASKFVFLAIPLFYFSHRVVDQGWQRQVNDLIEGQESSENRAL